MHNGYIGDFHLLRRDLMLAVDPSLFAEIEGSTDTEVVFYLALTLGLEDDPVAALERTVGLIQETARKRGAVEMVQGTFGVSDGTTLWAVRHATEGRARTLFASEDATTIQRLHPENPRFQRLTAEDRVVVSEPFSDLPGVWREIPQETAVTVSHGGVFEHARSSRRSADRSPSGRRMPEHPAWARWTAPPRPWTVGAEEELMLLDARTFAVVNRVDHVLAVAPESLRAHASPETHACVVE